MILLLLAVLALILSAAPVVRADDEASPPLVEGNADAHDAPPTMADFKKMRVKELRAIVEDRGMECKGCAEKADYVQRAAEVYHLPRIEKKTAETPPVSDEEMERIMRQMEHGPDPTGDKERDEIMKRLHAKGLKFAGGNNMPIDQLRNLEKSMGAFGGFNGGGKPPGHEEL